MNKLKVLMAMSGVVVLLVLSMACSNGKAATLETGPDAAPPVDVQAAGLVGEPRRPPVSAPVPAPVPVPLEVGVASGYGSVPTLTGSSLLQVGGQQQSGIWVFGEGSMTLEPDLAILSLGVESLANTVAEAQGQAALAMNSIIAALSARGVSEADIQTQSFNIWPRYEYGEVEEGGLRTHKQFLVGYQVNNSAQAKIRDLDAIGVIIDEVAAAGGDLTRINGISFTVDDFSPFMVELREQAVMDALAKAEQFASLSGVSLGRLTYLAESGRGPVVESFAQKAFVMVEAAAAPTPLSGGELEIRLTVQAVFDIQ